MAGHTEAQTQAAFWAKVDKTGSCWLWIGSKGAAGYGQFRRGMRHGASAHRFACEWSKGLIPNGLEIDHLCRNRSCVNPAHLEAVSHRQNMLRGETLAATNAVKTHCRSGHPLSGANLYMRPDGHGRICKTCQRQQLTALLERSPEYREKQAIARKRSHQKRRESLHGA